MCPKDKFAIRKPEGLVSQKEPKGLVGQWAGEFNGIVDSRETKTNKNPKNKWENKNLKN